MNKNEIIHGRFNIIRKVSDNWDMKQIIKWNYLHQLQDSLNITGLKLHVVKTEICFNIDHRCCVKILLNKTTLQKV